MKKRSILSAAKVALLLLVCYLSVPSASAQYCSPAFINSCFSWSNQAVTLGGLNWTSTDCTTSDYTAQVATVSAGAIWPMTVTSGNYTGCSVWVDFNNDFDFDDPGENLWYEYIAFPGTGVGTYTFNIAIPASVTPGNYRMRVLATWGSDGFNPGGNGSGGACATDYQYGNFDDFTLTVTAPCVAPVIGTEPIAATPCGGDAINLSASATGATTYQWQLNGNSIAGATDATYSVPAAASADSGTYSLIAFNACGGISSDTALVAVTPAVAINTQPSSQSGCVGSAVSIAVGAAGASSYQWQLGGVDIPGATNANYIIGSMTAADGGIYTVNISGSCGSPVTSNSATLTVNSTAAITTQPVATSACTGSPASFTAAATGGTTYQWQLNGVNLPGATNATYTIPSASNVNAGQYNVLVNSASCGNASSDTVALTVNPMPVTATTLSSQPMICAGDTLTITVGAGFTYQWLLNGAVISGATNASFGAGASGNYSVQLSNGTCTDTSAAVAVTVNPLPVPVIGGSGGSLFTGSFASYQWFLNGVAIPGATTANYIATANGDYTVLVTDGVGCSDTSAVHTVSGLSVAQTTIASEIKMYPNPVNTMLYIESSITVNVIVTEMTGKVVLEQKAAREVNVSNLPEGVYLVKLADSNGLTLKTEKLIKTK